jgi:hypothetical protein
MVCEVIGVSMKYKNKIKSGSDRDKKEQSKKQNKWINPFYFCGTKRSIARNKKIKEETRKRRLALTKKKLGLNV